MNMMQATYTANTAGTGYSINDVIHRADIWDNAANPNLISTLWFNATTGLELDPAPTQAHLTAVSGAGSSGGSLPSLGQSTKSGSLPVTLASNEDPQSVFEKQATPSWTSVAATGAIGTLLAADSTRRRFIATNPKGSSASVGLSVKNNATFAQCEIILAAGESWVEALAATAQWYVIMESGTATVPVQTAV